MIPLTMVTPSLIWISATLAIFFACRKLYLRLGYTLLNPVLWSTVTVALLVLVTRHPREAFATETHPMVWLLGPAVVALARPVWSQRRLIALNWRMFGASVGVSVVLSVATLLLLPPVLGPDLARALAVKSVTAPVALGIAQRTGLPPDLVIVGVMTSGLFGMVFGPAVLAVVGLKGDQPEIGAALGCASHGLGTARAYETGQTAGAFASVSMGLSALAYGFLLPGLLAAL
jgi:putative effector of murein hydrolase